MSLRHLQQQLQPRAGFTFWTVEHMNQGDSVLPTHVNQASHDRVPEADMHSFEAEAPKLPQRSGCSRILLLVLCLGCLGLTAWAVGSVLVLPGSRRPELHERPLPTMLRRFSHLKRMPPGTGTNEQQLRAMFPHWFANGQPSPEVILMDVSLAIAQLTNRVAPARTESVFPDGIDEENASHGQDSDL